MMLCVCGLRLGCECVICGVFVGFVVDESLMDVVVCVVVVCVVGLVEFGVVGVGVDVEDWVVGWLWCVGVGGDCGLVSCWGWFEGCCVCWVGWLRLWWEWCFVVVGVFCVGVCCWFELCCLVGCWVVRCLCVGWRC